MRGRLPWPAVALLAALVAVLVPAVSIADSRSQAQELESIRRRMETGLALFVGGKQAEAAAEFDAGYAEHPYSAFLFNAGVCYQKLGTRDKALERYREYLRVDPAAPDAETIKKRIAELEAEGAAAAPPPAVGDAGAVPAVTPPIPAGPPPSSTEIPASEGAMRSLVVVETEPPGAPLRVYRADAESTPGFQYGAANPGWAPVVTTTAPTSLTLAVGRYHIVIDKFRDFNVSETDIKVSAGHVYNFKANLSQGVFMSFLRVAANVTGAHVWLDDPKKAKPEWGTTPYGELVPAGTHEVLVEIAGFQPMHSSVELVHGEQKELQVRLSRTDYGFIRVDADAPDAKVHLDQEPRGIWKSGEPPLDVRAPAGKHRLTVESSGRKELDAIVEVPRGQVLPVHAKLIPKYPRGGAWTQAVISGVLIGTGVFFGIESDKLYDQAKADRGARVLDPGDSRIARGRIYAVTADCAFGAGGLLAALATYGFLKDPLPSSSVRLDKLQEFDDPLQARPTALAPREHAPRVARRPAEPSRAGAFVTAAPTAVGNGGGFVLGGTF